jgi:hypothetical protein
MNFVRGIEPFKSLEIGRKKILKDMKVLFISQNDLQIQNKTLSEEDILEKIERKDFLYGISRSEFYEASVVILVLPNYFRFLKCRYIVPPYSNESVFSISELDKALDMIISLVNEINEKGKWIL